MIKKKTVFILGAGASVPYGFPTGEKLKQNILAEINGRYSFSQNMIKIFGLDHVDNFAHSFKFSSRKSIDAFLEHNPQFQELGKMFIANEISKYELNEKLISAERNWYGELFNKICGSNFEDILRSNVSFVTFNYDRSIKQFFFNSLKFSFNKKDEEVAKVISQIPIIHVHGSLGNLPWEINQNGISKAYQPMTFDELSTISKNIKIIHESNHKNSEFQNAHDLISESENVIFLGFGFHQENMERLKAEELLKKKKIFMDYKGPLGDSAIYIQKKLGRVPVHENYHQLDFHWISNDSLGLFQYFSSLIFN